MRLVYTTRQYPELTETFVTEEIRQLVALGHGVHVVAPYAGNGTLDGAPPARYFEDVTPRERLRGAAELGLRRPVGALRAVLDPAARFGLPAVEMASLAPFAATAARADHIHAHFATEPATLAAQLSALSGTPFSFTAHAYDLYVQPEGLAEKLARCSMAVMVSEYNSGHVRAKHPEHAHKLRLVRYGVDTDRFRRTLPYEPDGPILAVGRLVPKKGFSDLVRAAAAAGRDAIPEVVIAGDGPQREELEALIGELDAPVRLLGAKTHEEVLALYERASSLALPCVVAPDGDRDGMPLVIKEALAMELPYLGTTEVAIPEEITPEVGVLVDPGDWRALGDELRRLYERPAAERAAMGRAARALVLERFTLRRHTEQLLECFAEAL